MKQSVPTYTKTAFLLILVLSLLVIGCLARIAAGGFFGKMPFTDAPGPGSGGTIAEIYQNGTLMQSISLDSVTEPYTFTVTGENGCRNEVEVRPGSIGIISADCPDKLCVRQGFIHTSLLPVTCLPNRLVIQIRSGEAPPEAMPDIITY